MPWDHQRTVIPYAVLKDLAIFCHVQDRLLDADHGFERVIDDLSNQVANKDELSLVLESYVHLLRIKPPESDTSGLTFVALAKHYDKAQSLTK